MLGTERACSRAAVWPHLPGPRCRRRYSYAEAALVQRQAEGREVPDDCMICLGAFSDSQGARPAGPRKSGPEGGEHAHRRARPLPAARTALQGCTHLHSCSRSRALLPQVRLLRCGHLFHTECIDEWFERSYRCPCCKAECCRVG